MSKIQGWHVDLQANLDREFVPPKSFPVLGDKSPDVKRLQEWLCLFGQLVTIDGDYGPATRAAAFSVASTPEEQWRKLTANAFEATRHMPATTHEASTIGAQALVRARILLKAYPHEVGGQNRGPWVRLCMDGHEGDAYPWCAGFVSLCYALAARDLGVPTPFHTFSCDVLGALGHTNGSITKDSGASAKPGAIFLIRKSDKDWTHCGIVTRVGADYFETIEGNTNDEGSREGYEVCARKRAFRNVNFVTV